MPDSTKKRPAGVAIFLLLYLLVTLSLITTASLTYSLKSPYPLYLFHLLFAATSVYIVFGLLKVKFSSWLLLYIQAGLVFLFTLFSSKFSLTVITIDSVNIVPLTYFFCRRVRKAYSKKHFNWWDQPKRYLYEIVIEMHNRLFYTFDISKKGAFIKDDVTDLQVGELIPICINIDDIKIKCFAEVVWINKNSNHNYPAGFALKYNRINHRDRQQLDYFIKLLQELKTEKLR